MILLVENVHGTASVLAWCVTPFHLWCVIGNGVVLRPMPPGPKIQRVLKLVMHMRVPHDVTPEPTSQEFRMPIPFSFCQHAVDQLKTWRTLPHSVCLHLPP